MVWKWSEVIQPLVPYHSIPKITQAIQCMIERNSRDSRRLARGEISGSTKRGEESLK